MNAPPMRQGLPYAAAVIALWAGFVLVSRIGGTGTLSPYDITALRFGTAALVLVPVWFFRRRVALFTPRMLALALVGGLGYSLTVYGGFRHAPAAHGALLVSGLLPFMIALCVWAMLGESPRRAMQRGLWLIAAGVCCLAFDTFRHGDFRDAGVLVGDALLVAASACWAVYTVLVRRWGVGPWETTTGVALLASLLYLPPYFVVTGTQLFAAPAGELLLQGVYQGILVVIVAMVLYMQAMERLGPARLSALLAVVPALGGIGVSWVLAEPLTGWLVAGLLLTSAGAWVGVRE